MASEQTFVGESTTSNGNLRAQHLPPGWPAPHVVADAPEENPSAEAAADQPRPNRLGGLTRRAGVVLAACALFGAVVGGLLYGLLTPDFTAVALVQGSPARLNPSALSQEDDRYAQTEAAYARLAEAEVAAALAKRAPEGARPAEVTVVPGTTILRFTGTGDTAQEAVDAANVSADIYVTSWRTRTTDALKASLAVIDTALARPAVNADSLAEQRTELDTQLAAVEAVERVVEPATVATSEHTGGIMSGSILGALITTTGALAALLWHRRPSLDETRVLP